MNLMTIIVSHLFKASLLFTVIALILYIGHKLFGWQLNKKTLLPLVLIGAYVAAVQIIGDILKSYDVPETTIEITRVTLMAALIFIILIYPLYVYYPQEKLTYSNYL